MYRKICPNRVARIRRKFQQNLIIILGFSYNRKLQSAKYFLSSNSYYQENVLGQYLWKKIHFFIWMTSKNKTANQGKDHIPKITTAFLESKKIHTGTVCKYFLTNYCKIIWHFTLGIICTFVLVRKILFFQTANQQLVNLQRPDQGQL